MIIWTKNVKKNINDRNSIHNYTFILQNPSMSTQLSHIVSRTKAPLMRYSRCLTESLLRLDCLPLTRAWIRAASSFVSDKAYINGEWVKAKHGKSFEGMYHYHYLYLLRALTFPFQIDCWSKVLNIEEQHSWILMIESLLVLIDIVVNPATGKVLGSVPDMDATDTKNAIESAYRAFQTWKETTATVDLLMHV